jgi:hypothetical protein
MGFNRFGTGMTPEQMSARLALIRTLIKNQFSQRPRNTWDGITNLVAAISSRVAQNQLGRAETVQPSSPQAKFAPLVEALKKRQIGISSPSSDPRQEREVIHAP